MTKSLFLSTLLSFAFLLPAKPQEAKIPFANFQQVAGDYLYKSDTSAIRMADALAHKRHLVVLFSASWCGPCQAVCEELKRIYAANGDKRDWEVVLVSTDKSKAEMFSYMSSHAMPWFTAEYDDTPHLPKLRKLYTGSESGIPNFVVINTQGTVVLKASDFLPLGKTHAECLDELRKIVSTPKSE
ncbi:thioredoxin-like domain-containing protein [Prosthecobacter sp.]|jgi:thiol-disulfide isomerase/thioredoxin|uniref:thioredoxin-like domain-containing protein n=1 Tax=Prosthecobacter sp. TaxID=1965333 RepID=UPI0037C7F640